MGTKSSVLPALPAQVLTVYVTVQKSVWEPALGDSPLTRSPTLLKSFEMMIILLPLLSGILLTFDTSFNPNTKWNALKWASAAVESEIYRYRVRVGIYGRTGQGETNWAESILHAHSDTDEEHDEPPDEWEKSSPAKNFVGELTHISEELMSGPIMNKVALKHPTHEAEEQFEHEKFESLFKGTVCQREGQPTAPLPRA